MADSKKGHFSKSPILNTFYFSFKGVKIPVSGKENVRFTDSPDFEILPDFRTDMTSGRALPG